MATPSIDRIDDLRKDLHGVDSRVVRVESELKAHRDQSALQHTAIMDAIGELRNDLSDQGPPPPPPPPPTGGTLAVSVSPGTLVSWLRVIVPILGALGVGGGIAKAIDTIDHDPPTVETSP